MRNLRIGRIAALFFLLAAIMAIVFSIRESSAPAFVILRWSTRREIKTAGYLIYRAENNAGPFLQITRDLIPAVNDPYLGGSYVYTDTATIAGVTYYYQLEDVGLDGARMRQEPIVVTARVSSPTIFGQPISLPSLLIAFVLAGIGLMVSAATWIVHGKR